MADRKRQKKKNRLRLQERVGVAVLSIFARRYSSTVPVFFKNTLLFTAPSKFSCTSVSTIPVSNVFGSEVQAGGN